MKTKNLFLLLLLITFGSSDLIAQTVQPTTNTEMPKPKRKYTKRVKPEANYSTQGMPTNTADVSAKPKRKYTRKAKLDNSAPAATVQTSVSTTSVTDPIAKPKRKYTRRTSVTSNTAVPPVVTSTPVVNNNYQTRTAVPQKTVYRPTSGGVEGKHQILVGPRGGRYYINKNGNKTYVK